MADPNAGIPVRVVLGAQSLQVEIVVPPVAEASALTPEHCLEALAGSEVEITDEVRRRVGMALASLEVGKELRAIVGEATQPEHAIHGRTDWHVGPEANHPAPVLTADEVEDPDAEDKQHTSVDHYARTSYTMVTTGQVLGMIIPPTKPVDGRDVRGRVLKAKAGRPTRLRHDDSIAVDEEGRIIAQCDGVLSRSLGKWAVRDYIQIPGYVDFSTGNIDFSGDIEVVRGVRDCFHVSAEGNFEIQGLVEAAHLRTGGDLYARGGVAGRERGSLHVQGDLVAKYLDGTTIEVGGTLRVMREILNCTTMVHADVESPSATLMGGVITPTGRVRLGAIGSAGGVRTRLVLNSVPRLEPKLAESERLISQLTKQTEGMAQGSANLERARERVAQFEQTRDRLRETIDALRTVNVWVSIVIHHGAQFVVDGRVWELREDLAGPVTIRMARDGALEYRVGKGGEPRPLIEVCDPDLRTAA